MGFSREAIFLRWNGGSSHYAFKALQKQHRGGVIARRQTLERAIGGELRDVTSLQYRVWLGQIKAEKTPTGAANDGSGEVSYGSLAHLRAAHVAQDLEALFHEDAAYLTVEWIGDLNPQMELDPDLEVSVVAAEFWQRELT